MLLLKTFRDLHVKKNRVEVYAKNKQINKQKKNPGNLT